jgi:hypothetical protein
VASDGENIERADAASGLAALAEMFAESGGGLLTVILTEG